MVHVHRVNIIILPVEQTKHIYVAIPLLIVSHFVGSSIPGPLFWCNLKGYLGVLLLFPRLNVGGTLDFNGSTVLGYEILSIPFRAGFINDIQGVCYQEFREHPAGYIVYKIGSGPTPKFRQTNREILPPRNKCLSTGLLGHWNYAKSIHWIVAFRPSVLLQEKSRGPFKRVPGNPQRRAQFRAEDVKCSRQPSTEGSVQGPGTLTAPGSLPNGRLSVAPKRLAAFPGCPLARGLGSTTDGQATTARGGCQFMRVQRGGGW